MISPNRSRSLAPRLVLLFAVLVCLLGLGQAGASAQTSPDASQTASMPTAVAADSGHAAHEVATPAVRADDRSLAAAPGEGHAGHGSDAGHALNCMSAIAVAALGAIALTDAATLVSPVFSAPVPRLRSAVLAVSYPRPPDIATLCVQRI